MNRVLKVATKYAKSNILAVRTCSVHATSGPDRCSPSLGYDVPGLSAKIVNIPTHEVGFPGASKSGAYKNPEYFCYHSTSYFEAEVEMMKYRLPQPSSSKPDNN